MYIFHQKPPFTLFRPQPLVRSFFSPPGPHMLPFGIIARNRVLWFRCQNVFADRSMYRPCRL